METDTNKSSEQLLVCGQIMPESVTVESVVESVGGNKSNNDAPDANAKSDYQNFLKTLGLKEIPMILNGTYFKIKSVNSEGIIIKCECQICLHPRILSASLSCTSNLTTHLKVRLMNFVVRVIEFIFQKVWFS